MDEEALPIELRGLGAFRLKALTALSATVIDAYRLVRGGRVRFGEGVIANHRLIIRGPGRVVVEDRANLFAFSVPTRLNARTPTSLIRIGRNARLNGTLLQCDTRIEIGPDCILGDAHVLDTDMHSLSLDRRTNPAAPVRIAPVILEANVWVGSRAAILPGVRIGEGSVVGFGSVVAGDVPPGVLVAGNPARVIRSLS